MTIWKYPIETTDNVYGTGHPVGLYREYLGSFQLRGGDLVFHVFEVD